MGFNMKKWNLKLFEVVLLSNSNKAIIKEILQDSYLVLEFEPNGNINEKIVYDDEIDDIIFHKR